MPKFGPRSKKNIAELHPDLQLLCSVAIRYFDFTVIEGYRGEEEQNAAFKSGKSTKQYPNSKHNLVPSIAFDAVPHPLNWKDLPTFYFMAGVILTVAKTLGIKIRFGGDWDGDHDFNDQTLYDLVHFELVQT